MRKTFIFVALFITLGAANLWAQSADIGIGDFGGGRSYVGCGGQNSFADKRRRD